MTEPYLKAHLDSEENVANGLAEEFYKDHNALTDKRAIEVEGTQDSEIVVMRTRYCLRRELGICRKLKNGSKAYKDAKEPFYIQSGHNRFKLKFDCSNCEMQVIAQ